LTKVCDRVELQLMRLLLSHLLLIPAWNNILTAVCRPALLDLKLNVIGIDPCTKLCIAPDGSDYVVVFTERLSQGNSSTLTTIVRRHHNEADR